MRQSLTKADQRPHTQADARAMIHAVNVAKCQPEPDYAPPSKKVKCSPEQLLGFQILLA